MGQLPMMEVFCNAKSIRFWEDRVWGTIGYSVGVQLAGWVYHQFSPQAALLYGFDHHFTQHLLSKCGSNEEKRQS